MGSLVPERGEAFQSRLITPEALADIPLAPTKVQAGDTLRIIRDAQESTLLDLRQSVNDSLVQTYVVRGDGTFSFRFAGRINAAGKTPDEIAIDLSKKLSKYYQEPAVTINIVSSPSSKLVIGGAVRNPGSLELHSVATLEQAIFATGGLQPSADPSAVALLRLDANDKYQVYFLNLSHMLDPSINGRGAVVFQRGDIVFVPQSRAGAAGEGVQVYFNQLLPFARTLGVSVNKSAD